MDNSSVYSRQHRASINTCDVDGLKIGGTNQLFLMAGPCLVEDMGICFDIIDTIQALCEKYNVNYIFKASYDKANKTIKDSYRGPGWRSGLELLEKIKAQKDVPILTDVHEIEQCKHAANVASILQIPALLSKQIDLIIAAAETGKTVNIKKGQFTPAWEANNVISRLKDNGFDKIIVTDRGYMFGYGTLVSDMRALQIMTQFKVPVVFDGSHSVHGNDTIITGGHFKHRDFIRPLVRSAVANGVDGVFIEVHPEPEKALSDATGTFPLSEVELLLKEMTNIERALNS